MTKSSTWYRLPQFVRNAWNQLLGKKKSLQHSGKRICQLCLHPIKRQEKYQFIGLGVQHRDCQDPQGLRVESPQQELIP